MAKNYKKRFSYKISLYNRTRKYENFIKIFKPDSETKILDIGYNDNEYRDTENFLEKNYVWPSNITALGIMEPKNFNVYIS